MSDPNLSSFIWSVADLLRGDYKQSEYGKVILPFTVLRRLDCVLEATKPAVLAEKEKREKAGLNAEPFLLKKSARKPKTKAMTAALGPACRASATARCCSCSTSSPRCARPRTAAAASASSGVAACEESIALLQEHRTALISAAVTGQIDVRNAISA